MQYRHWRVRQTLVTMQWTSLVYVVFRLPRSKLSILLFSWMGWMWEGPLDDGATSGLAAITPTCSVPYFLCPSIQSPLFPRGFQVLRAWFWLRVSSPSACHGDIFQRNNVKVFAILWAYFPEICVETDLVARARVSRLLYAPMAPGSAYYPEYILKRLPCQWWLWRIITS